MLAPAAIEAVKQWIYKPYLLNGVPVAVETHVEVNFQLSDNPPRTAGRVRRVASRVPMMEFLREYSHQDKRSVLIRSASF
jgi:hypothetical protein